MKYIFRHPWIEAYTKKMTPLLRQYTDESLNSSGHSLSSGVADPVEANDNNDLIRIGDEASVVDKNFEGMDIID